MATNSRRIFLQIASATAAFAVLPCLAASSAAQRHGGNAHRGRRKRRPDVRDDGHQAEFHYGFFDADDAAFIEAAVERLIPADKHGPGALQAGVTYFIDRQLAGAWTTAGRLYRGRYWSPGRLLDGYRLPRTPGELFRSALRGIEVDLSSPPMASAPAFNTVVACTRMPADTCRDANDRSIRSESARRHFASLPSTHKDAYLQSLRAGEKNLAGVPSQLFFECLFTLTIEGFFSDPAHSGNEDTVAMNLHDPPGSAKHAAAAFPEG